MSSLLDAKPFNGEENSLGSGVKNSTLDFSTETCLLVMLPVSTHNKYQQYRLLIPYNTVISFTMVSIMAL